MRITRRTAVIIAIVCAASAALLMVVYLQSLAPKPALQPQVETVMVPVFLTPLAAGTRITAAKLTSKNVPRDSLAADAITDPQDLYGQVLVAEAPAGEPLRRSMLAAFSPQAGLAFVVPDGMRAVTVAVDNISGVSGFVKLGDRVDVLATFEAQQQAVTRTILQDVEVLGLGAQSITPQPAKEGEEGGEPQAQPAGAKPSATLAVTPQQAQVLVLATNKGKLHLALRPKSDSRMVAMPPASNQQVIGFSLVAAPPPSATPAPSTPAGTTVNAMGTVGTRMGAGLTPGGEGMPGIPGAPGTPGAGGGAATSTGPTVEVFKGTVREVVTP